MAYKPKVLDVIEGGTGISATTAQEILYSSATNVIGQLTTANSALAATNAAGTLAMRALSVNVQTFTTAGPGSYTPTTGMLYCIIECVGGGGAGGGAASTIAAQFSGGAGGGAGEYAIGKFSAATIGVSQSLSVGAAGSANSGAAGGNGGTSSVGSTLISAIGGSGGNSAGANGTISVALGGLGGTGGTGGDYRTPGNPGNYCLTLQVQSALLPGYGGSSIFGAAGFANNSATAVGGAGLGRGAGGGGSGNLASQSASLGGTGAVGIIIIREFIIN